MLLQGKAPVVTFFSRVLYSLTVTEPQGMTSHLHRVELQRRQAWHTYRSATVRTASSFSKGSRTPFSVLGFSVT